MFRNGLNVKEHQIGYYLVVKYDITCSKHCKIEKYIINIVIYLYQRNTRCCTLSVLSIYTYSSADFPTE